jgi:sugar lactone lactonase YvrE
MQTFKPVRLWALVVSACLLAACGGGGSGSPPPVTTPTQSFSVGGSVTGLLGATGLTLVQGSETLPIAANATAFTFVNKVAQNGSYSVRIAQQPAGMTCSASRASGMVALTPVQSVAVDCTPTGGRSPFTVSTFAGDDGQTWVDGVGASARFGDMRAIAMDSAGNMYVHEANGQTVRKVSPQGVVTTLAGNGTPGFVDGTGTNARFGSPVVTDFPTNFYSAQSLATDRAGNVYVVDQKNHAIRKITPSGTVTTLAGNGVAGFVDGEGGAARFKFPSGVAVDGGGNVFVADQGNHAIRKISPSGVVSTLAGDGVAGLVDGAGATARFNYPSGLTLDSAGNLFIADTYNRAVRKLTASGVVTTVASNPNSGGQIGIGLINHAVAIAGDSVGNLYVLSEDTRELVKLTPDGKSTPFAPFFLDNPTGLLVDANDNLLIADRTARFIRKVSPSGEVSVVAGQGYVFGLVDATGTAARFQWAGGVATDTAGNVYVADSQNNRIRKITPLGEATTLAGGGNYPGDALGDGTGAAASFSSPGRIAVDGAGNLYVTESSRTDRKLVTIRKVSPLGVVTTLPRKLDSSALLAVDAVGNLYFADKNRVYKMTTDGVTLSPLAGDASAGYADGSGSSARFNGLRGIAVDGAGNVYVSDTNNKAIRKISPTGAVTTLASGLPGYPGSVVVDANGRVYVCLGAGNFDSGIAIAKINASGGVTLVAGDGMPGQIDGPGAIARFNLASAMAVDSSGNIYVADHAAIRKIVP